MISADFFLCWQKSSLSFLSVLERVLLAGWSWSEAAAFGMRALLAWARSEQQQQQATWRTCITSLFEGSFSVDVAMFA